MLKRILRGILIAYALVVIVLGFFQRSLLYHPRKAADLSVAAFADVLRVFPDSQDIKLTSADGVTIRGWLLKNSGKSDATPETRRPLVLYFHGNAGNRAGRLNWYKVFDAAGADVLAIDYHGYGDSEGAMTEGALETDTLATWNYATVELGYQPNQIIVAGTSLGGAAAVYLTAEKCRSGQAPAAMIGVATFSSMVDVAGSLYPWLPVGAILVDRYPSLDRISDITCPILLMHGDVDTLVQHKLGRKLFEAAPKASLDGTARRWVTLPGVGHNDLLSSAGSTIREEVVKLIQSVQK